VGSQKLPHRVLFPRGNDKIFGKVLLEHEPLHFYVVFGVAPVAFGIQIAKKEALLEIEVDAGQCPGDLAGDKGFAAQGRLMVEEDAIAEASFQNLRFYIFFTRYGSEWYPAPQSFWPLPQCVYGG